MAVIFGTPGRGYAVRVTESLWPMLFTATTVRVVDIVFFRDFTSNEVALGPATFALLLFGTQITL